MNHIEIDGKNLEYMLKINNRARYMRVAMSQERGITVTVPRFVPKTAIEKFLHSKASWILKTRAHLASLPPPLLPPAKRGDYARHKQRALELATSRVAYFARIYGVMPNRVSVRNQKTRWGSCSKRGNLNFNYKIALLPPALADYIIVHEVCHLKELNHSPKFWSLVEKTIPNHKVLRKQLRTNSAI